MELTDPTSARAALILIHQLVKELDWVRMLAHHLPERLGDEVRARRDAERIGALASDLAERARAFLDEAAGDARQPAKRSLQVVVDGAIRSVSERFGADRVEACVPSELAQVPVDPTIESLLVDLLDNSLMASTGGGAVELRASREGDLLEIVLTDEGDGMTAEHLSRCFEPGFSARAGGEGHGLGLALCRAAIAAIGGGIEIDSEEGRGTRVVLSFPVGKRSAAA